MQVAENILLGFASYLGVGLVFGLWFVTLGAARFDPDARGMAPQARAILLPGAAALWPLLAWKQLRGKGPPLQ